MNLVDEYDDEPQTSARGPRHAARVPLDVAEDIHARLAAMQVRRKTDQHHCTARRDGICAHPNHRRDMHYLTEMLDMLGLDHGYPAYTAAENRTWLRWVGQSGPAEDQAA